MVEVKDRLKELVNTTKKVIPTDKAAVERMKQVADESKKERKGP